MPANAYCMHRNSYYAKRALWIAERLIAAFILAYCVKYEELCSDYAENKQK